MTAADDPHPLDVSDASVDLDGGRSTDVLVVGGGPAGLTAAIYLARFHLGVTVVDRGGGRASIIPNTRNHAGFPDGVTGRELVDRMRDQAARYGTMLVDGEVDEIAGGAGGFIARGAGMSEIKAGAVLLATGVTNRRPTMDGAVHDRAIEQGLLRYCPICDGYEITDQRVAVIGSGDRGFKEAMFLRSYTAQVTMIASDGPHQLDDAQRRALCDAGIALIDGPCRDVAISDDRISIATAAGGLAFDTAYPALGSDIHSALAVRLGAKTSGDGCVIVDSHQRTSVPGLYAAGDVVIGLDQISHAMGEGGVAATAIRNDLAAQSGLRREVADLRAD